MGKEKGINEHSKIYMQHLVKTTSKHLLSIFLTLFRALDENEDMIDGVKGEIETDQLRPSDWKNTAVHTQQNLEKKLYVFARKNCLGLKVRTR